MKNIPFFAIALLPLSAAYGQIIAAASPKELKRLKATTTLFVLRPADMAYAADFEKVIAESWTLTPFRVIAYGEIPDYVNSDSFSFFSFSGNYIDISGLAGKTFTATLQYDLWMPEPGRRGGVRQGRALASILLSQETPVKASATVRGWLAEKSIGEFIYYDATSATWGAGYLRGYLHTINARLQKGEAQSQLPAYQDKPALAALAHDTLYVPHTINVHFNAVSASDKETEAEEGKLADAYTHPMKLLPAADLNHKLEDAATPLYYLVYTRVHSDKFVSVYSTTAGLIYSRHTAVSYNFKDKDLRQLDKLVD